MSDSELQAAYAERLRDRPPSRKRCPPPEAIKALLERQGGETERLVTLDHVMNCGGCKADFDLMQAVAAGRPVPVRRFPMPMVAAAAVALLVSGSMIFLALRSDRAREGELRGGLSAIELVSPQGDAGSRPVTFVWRAGPAAARYALEVFNEAGDPVYTKEVSDTAVIMPDTISLTPGERYHWWVMVRTSDGREARSQPFRFTP